MNEQAFSIKIEKSPLETIRYEGKGTVSHAKSIFKKLLRISKYDNIGEIVIYNKDCTVKYWLEYENGTFTKKGWLKMTVQFIQGNLRDFFYMIDPFDVEGKHRVLIDEDVFIKLVNDPRLDSEYASEGPYRTNVLKFLDNDGNVLFVRVRCKVNRRGQPVDGFNVEKGIFEDNKKGGRI